MSNPVRLYTEQSKAIAGMLSSVHDIDACRIAPYSANTGQAKEYHTIATPSDPDDSTAYTLTITGGSLTSSLVISYTTDASGTREELRDGLYAAFRASAFAQSQMTVTKSGTSLVLTANRYEDEYTVVANTGSTTADITVTKTARVAGTKIPFGVFVGRAAADRAESAKIPTANTDRVLGVTMNISEYEKEGRGEAMTSGYKEAAGMSVLADCAQNAIWVKCLDSDLAVTDTALYVDVDTGYITKTSSGNISLGATAAVRQGATTDPEGNVIALIAFRLLGA